MKRFLLAVCCFIIVMYLYLSNNNCNKENVFFENVEALGSSENGGYDCKGYGSYKCGGSSNYEPYL